MLKLFKKGSCFLTIFTFLMFFVGCGGGGGGSDSNQFNSNQNRNLPPIIILKDFKVSIVVGKDAVIDASESGSQNSAALFFEWKLIKKPELSNLEFEGASEASINFIPDALGDYEFHLRVFERVGISAERNIKISAINKKPNIVVEHESLNFPVGHDVTFDLSLSTDLDEHSLSHFWNVIAKPENSQLENSGQSEQSNFKFKPDVEGVYTIEIYVYDGYEESVYNSYELNISPASPYIAKHLDFIPSFSQFNNIRNELYLLDAEQPFLYIYQVDSGNFDKITLPTNGNFFSISPDGNKISITHDGFVTFIDMNDRSIINTINSETLGGFSTYLDDYALIFPRSTFNERVSIRFINEDSLLPEVLDYFGSEKLSVPIDDQAHNGITAIKHPYKNEVFTVHPGILSGRPITRLVPENNTIKEKSIISSTIDCEDLGLECDSYVSGYFWFDENGNILTDHGLLIKSDFSGDTLQPQNEIVINHISDIDEINLAGIIDASFHAQSDEVILATHESNWPSKDKSKIYTYNKLSLELVNSYLLPQIKLVNGSFLEINNWRVFHANDGGAHIALGYAIDEEALEVYFYLLEYRPSNSQEENPPSVRVLTNPRATKNVEQSIVTSIFEKSSQTVDVNFDLINTPGASNSIISKGETNSVFTPDKTGDYEIEASITNGSLNALPSFRLIRSFGYDIIDDVEIGDSTIDLEVSPNGSHVYSAEETGRIFAINTNTLSVNTLELNETLHDLEISKLGNYLLAGSETGVYVINTSDLSLYKFIDLQTKVYDLTSISDRDFIFNKSNNGPNNLGTDSILKLNIDGIISARKNYLTNSYCVHKDDTQELICSAYLTIYRLHYSDNDLVIEENLITPQFEYLKIANKSKHQRYFVAGWRYIFEDTKIGSVNDFRIHRVVEYDDVGYIESIDWNNNESFAFGTTGTNYLNVYETNGYQIVARLPVLNNEESLTTNNVRTLNNDTVFLTGCKGLYRDSEQADCFLRKYKYE